MKVKKFFVNLIKGGAIGVAMIIPGVSGGTLAVLMGIYDDLVDAVGNIFKDFKKNFLTLLPIFLGAVLAVVAAYFPIKYALKYAPFPTILLFAGLMVGSIPDLIKKSNGNGFKKLDTLGMVLSFALVVGICFIPSIGNVDLSPDMPVFGYFLLILMGMLASCALVVPGISGSMLMLIFGYYNSLINAVSGLKYEFGHYLLVLALFGIGVIVGFFTIAKLMQFLLKRFKRTTFWAITGFVLGSIPAVVITFFNEWGYDLNTFLAPVQIAIGVCLFVLGAIATFFLSRFAVLQSRKHKINEAGFSTTDKAITQDEKIARTDGDNVPTDGNASAEYKNEPSDGNGTDNKSD